ncbi:iron-sulfur cluster assembly/repair protein ApbC [Ameyamaea chiangmaiensis NBRC 103196]|nr:iron-sulfur cluster assembly/repair protein ApbC [Ameyamaea chiangmaiensis NBRC 103196]
MSGPTGPADDAALRAAVEQALATVREGGSGPSLTAIAPVEGARLHEGALSVSLAVSREDAPRLEALHADAQAALERIPGVLRATLVLTAHRRPAPDIAPARPGPGHRPIGLGGAPAAEAPVLPDVGAMIAVASGKGGVGKSTTAVNLAVGLAREGLSVGLLDADIHGPSLPRMLGLHGTPEVRDGRLQPVSIWGLKAMSIGLLVDERQAMIWRGPMVMGALKQLLGEVDWGPLDVMIVDMPPGTGDAQLTLAQKAPLSGAIVVSTPQDIALIDARRGMAMFEKMRVPVLGLVENMSFFCCPNCGHRTELFGHGGARAEAESAGVPFLGEIPLLADIRFSADQGAPIVASAPDSDAGRAYAALAHTVAATIRRLRGRAG